jgi:hypothetical protein
MLTASSLFKNTTTSSAMILLMAYYWFFLLLPSLLQSQILHSRLQVEQGSLLLLLFGSPFQTQLAGIIIGALLPMLLLLVMLDNRFQSLLLLLLLSSRIVVEVMLPTLDAATRRSLSFDHLFGTSRCRFPHHKGSTFLVYSSSQHVIIVIVHIMMMFMILPKNRCFLLLEGYDIDTFAPQPSESSQLLIVIATGCISTLRSNRRRASQLDKPEALPFSLTHAPDPEIVPLSLFQAKSGNPGTPAVEVSSPSS